MSRRKWISVWVALGVFLCVILPLTCLQVGLALGPGRGTVARGWGDAVAVVRVEGIITSGREQGWPTSTTGNAYSESIVETLRRAEDDPSVKAIVLRVNSPGGGIVPSNEIFQALARMEKPIVVSMGDTAASGGYYISCAADKIVANAATLTGSIGVIATAPNLEELLDKIGIEMLIIKSGALKDELSPYRGPSEEEIRHWQGIVDEAYEQFVEVVAQGRNLSLDEARDLADGRVYTGQQALDVGLVDVLGNTPEAVSLAAELGGIEGEPRTIEYQRPPTLIEALLSALTRAQGPASLDELLGIERHFTIQYLFVSP